jgi:hypothetical protein
VQALDEWVQDVVQKASKKEVLEVVQKMGKKVVQGKRSSKWYRRWCII